MRRNLSTSEVGTLAKLVDAASPQFAPLHQQIAAAVVTGRCACGCASVDIAVDQSQAEPLGEPFTGVLPVEGLLWLPDRQFAAGVLVFLSDGWLVGLEVYTHGDDELVREFPGPERMEVVPGDPGA